MKIHLPWLNPKLSCNARTHWAMEAERHTAEGFGLSMFTPAQKSIAQSSDRINVRITFHAPDKRRRDKQNMPASGTIKAYLDGIADALGVDDNKFYPTFDYGDVIKGGRVVIEVLI